MNHVENWPRGDALTFITQLSLVEQESRPGCGECQHAPGSESPVRRNQRARWGFWVATSQLRSSRFGLWPAVARSGVPGRHRPNLTSICRIQHFEMARHGTTTGGAHAPQRRKIQKTTRKKCVAAASVGIRCETIGPGNEGSWPGIQTANHARREVTAEMMEMKEILENFEKVGDQVDGGKKMIAWSGDGLALRFAASQRRRRVAVPGRRAW